MSSISSDNGVVIAIVVGSSVGGAALLSLIAFFVLRHRNVKKVTSKKSMTLPVTQPTMAVST